MENGVYGSRTRAGSVQAAINMYGGITSQARFSSKRTQMDSTDSEESNSRSTELHQARRDTARYDDARKASESDKAQAEAELLNAKKAVRDLTQRIEETNSKARTHRQGVRELDKSVRRDVELAPGAGDADCYLNNSSRRSPIVLVPSYREWSDHSNIIRTIIPHHRK